MRLIFARNDNLIELSGLADAATGAAIDDATVSVRLKDRAGDEVAGASWPMALAFAGVAGTYRAVLGEALAVEPGRVYCAEVTANAGAGRLGLWTVELECVLRRA